MKLGTIVINRHSGERGIVVQDVMNCCSDNEVPVVYDEDTAFTGTEVSLLEAIGKYEAMPDPKKCGAGKEADCCIFLTVGQHGFECERFSDLRNNLIFKSGMSAQRHPKEVYPDCMNQGSG